VKRVNGRKGEAGKDFGGPRLLDRVQVVNGGGPATVSLLVRQDQWHPVLEGNATFVYRAEIDPSAVARGVRDETAEREPYDDEIRAYAALDERNAARLRAAGVETAAPSGQAKHLSRS
jgi:hypothetical protein